MNIFSYTFRSFTLEKKFFISKKNYGNSVHG